MISRKVLALTAVACQSLFAQTFDFAAEEAKAGLERKLYGLYLFIASMGREAGLTDTIHVDALPVTLAMREHDGRVDAHIARTSRSSLTIYLDERIVFGCPEDELKAMIAHELGHVVCGHRIDQRMPTGEGFYRMQAEADAVALLFVREETLRAALAWLQFPPAEIDARLTRARAVQVSREGGKVKLTAAKK